MQDPTQNAEKVRTNLVIRLVSFYLLFAEGIEFNPGPQTGSTSGCNGRGSGRGGRQDPIVDAFADTSVLDPASVSNRVDPPFSIRPASRSQNQPSVYSQPSVSSWLTGSQTQI